MSHLNFAFVYILIKSCFKILNFAYMFDIEIELVHFLNIVML